MGERFLPAPRSCSPRGGAEWGKGSCPPSEGGEVRGLESIKLRAGAARSASVGELVGELISCGIIDRVKRRISIDGPLDLKGTLAPLRGTFRDDGWWYTARTTDGPATLRVTRTREDLDGEAWGEGAENLLDRLEAIVGFGDDTTGFSTDHDLVSGVHRRNPGLRFGATGDVFAHLVVAIVAQKVTGTESARAMRGLRMHFSDPAPGPDPRLRLPPDPERIAVSRYFDFHELHLEKKRADTLIAVARLAARVDSLAGKSSAEAERFLLTLPGVGPWTVAETLVRSHGDADQVSVGDYHIKNLVVHHLTGRSRGTDEEMLELLEEFRPHRGRVVRLLHKLGHAPKFGPRSTPRNITRM
jgi:3-methyladenine DNA glycosylase/8-oxoguanine DNA glycosylase